MQLVTATAIPCKTVAGDKAEVQHQLPSELSGNAAQLAQQQIGSTVVRVT